MRIAYDRLQAMDVICSASSAPLGRAIRFVTAKLRNRNGLVEACRMQIANHVGYVVEMDGKFWTAEMLPDGLKINRISRFLDNTKRDRIVSVRRHYIYEAESIRELANEKLITMAQSKLAYDFRGVLEFLNLGTDSKNRLYCSEMVEAIANQDGATWDAWQLKHEPSRIAPIEIQFGRDHGIDVPGVVVR